MILKYYFSGFLTTLSITIADPAEYKIHSQQAQADVDLVSDYFVQPNHFPICKGNC